MTEVLERPAEVLSPTELSVYDIGGLAAEYMEEHGWCQHGMFDSEGRVCAQGALLAAVGVTPSATCFSNVAYSSYRKAAEAFTEYLLRRPERENGKWGIVNWNDYGMQTKDGVVRALRDFARGETSD